MLNLSIVTWKISPGGQKRATLVTVTHSPHSVSVLQWALEDKYLLWKVSGKRWLYTDVSSNITANLSSLCGYSPITTAILSTTPIVRPRPHYSGEIWWRNKSFGFGFEETSVMEITWLSLRHRFLKASFSRCFQSTVKRKAGVFKFLQFEERFRKASFSWRINVDGF